MPNTAEPLPVSCAIRAPCERSRASTGVSAGISGSTTRPKSLHATSPRASHAPSDAASMTAGPAPPTRPPRPPYAWAVDTDAGPPPAPAGARPGPSRGPRHDDRGRRWPRPFMRQHPLAPPPRQRERNVGHEEGDVTSERRGDLEQTRAAESMIVHLLERTQCGGGIARSATEACTRRNALVQRNRV